MERRQIGVEEDASAAHDQDALRESSIDSGAAGVVVLIVPFPQRFAGARTVSSMSMTNFCFGLGRRLKRSMNR